MKTEVPIYSQFNDVSDESWKNRSCSVVCLKMALDFFKPTDVPTIDELIEEGLKIGGYGEHGWTHKGIALLSHNHGVPAYAEEFLSSNVFDRTKDYKKEMLDYGIEKIKREVSSGNLFIASGTRGWKKDGGFHTFLIVGFGEDSDGENGGFYYHDPDFREEGGRVKKFINLGDFKALWRRMGVFISKPI